MMTSGMMNGTAMSGGIGYKPVVITEAVGKMV